MERKKIQQSRNLYILSLFIWIFPAFQGAIAQNLEGLSKLITFYPNKKAASIDSTLYLQKFIAAPVVTYSPETNLAFGTGAKYLFKFNGSGEETRASNIPMSIRYTLNNQFIFYSGFEVFINQEKWVIEGNLLFQNYPRLFYGKGNNSSKNSKLEYNYYQFLAEPIFLKEILIRYLFAGAGLRFNTIYNVQYENSNTLNIENIDGFNGSTSSGIEAAVLYDSRNNILNADDGWYIEATYGIYSQALGGTHNFELIRIDARHFLKVSISGNDVLGFQLLGRFSNGDVPFNELSLLGGKDIMRGYREGRYVDRNLIAGQMEYRKSFGNSRWGAVAFLGGGDVSSKVDRFNLKSIRPSYGIGIRFKLDKTENLNLRFDYGIGQGSNYFYFTIAEAF